MDLYLVANNSNLSKRVALRQQQKLEARRKHNARMLGVGLGVLALVVVVLIIVAVADTVSSKVPAVEQFTPPDVTERYGIIIKSRNTQPMSDVSNVVVYEDSQHPICEGYGTQYDNAMLQLIDERKITLEVHIAYFLDDQTEQTPNKKPSQRVAIAAAAADAAGKYRECHKVIYENQPHEDVGYTDQQLRVDFVAKVGIMEDNLATFQKLYDTRTYADLAKNSHEAMGKAGIGGAPTYVVNGKKVSLGNLSSNDP